MFRTLFAVSALTCCASATPVPTGPGTPHFSGMPPQRFWREDATIVVFVADVTPYCGEAPAGLTTIACTKRKDGQAFVIMPHPAPYGEAGDYYARIMAHEMAHVAGWTANHEE